jgi:hypothetical protein
MGQYYLLINLDKRERMGSLATLISRGYMSKFSSGQKMAEQLVNLGVKPLLALALLEFDDATKAIIPNPLWGSWSGDRVVLIGDYSDGESPFLTEEERSELETKKMNLNKLANNEFRELADDHNKWIENAGKLAELISKPAHHVVVNLATREYLDPESFGDGLSVDNFSLERDGVMKGLFSCLFYSTGGGGGDIEKFKQGRWAGDPVKIISKGSLASEYDDISEEVFTAVSGY